MKISPSLEYRVEAGEKKDKLDGVAFAEDVGVSACVPSLLCNFL